MLIEGSGVGGSGMLKHACHENIRHVTVQNCGKTLRYSSSKNVRLERFQLFPL